MDVFLASKPEIHTLSGTTTEKDRRVTSCGGLGSFYGAAFPSFENIARPACPRGF